MTKRDFICSYCEKPFQAYGDRKYCSKKCSHIGSKGKRRNYRPRDKNKNIKPLRTKICEYCNEPFQLRYGDKNHCSTKCAKKNNGRKARQKRLEKYYKNPLRCRECDILIEYDKVQGKGGDCKDFCSLSCVSKHSNRIVYEKKMKEYYLNPPACLNCETIIPYEKRNDASKFCNQTCYSEYTIKENLENGVTLYPHCRVTFHICKVTKKPYLATNPNGPGYRRSPYIKSASKKYKTDASFRFNIYNYPDYFDLVLLEKYGLYHPINNKNGVSRDHRFSIMEGFRQNIEPRLLSHPANCILLIHTDNIIKKDQCSISLKKLIDEIEQWNKKYGKYNIGYNLYHN